MITLQKISSRVAPALFSTARPFSSSSDSPIVIRSLTFPQFGVPENVLKLEKTELPHSDILGERDILIKMLAAPINPSDINTIEGRYAIRPPLPAVPGHEGVGVIEAVGSKVTSMHPGDRVVPIEHGQGTWRSHGVFREQFWYRIPKDLPISTAATMVVNPPTAIRLLEDYVDLGPGDSVIANGGTSAVGKYIVQLARHMGITPICVIRDRPPKEKAQVEHELKEMGAALVTTRTDLKSKLHAVDIPPPKLALDCVGGEEATAIAKTLAPGGTMVVYGGMSQQPIALPSSLFIFKNIKVQGFWLTGDYAHRKDGWKMKQQLVDRVCAMFRQRVLHTAPVECVPFDEYKKALEMYRKPHRNVKMLLTNFPDDACY